MTVQKDNGHLTPQQRRLNYRLSSCRQTVERGIGLLKGRFRKLREVYCRDVKHVCRLITAACCLHNMCILADDDAEVFAEEEEEVNGYVNIFGNAENAVQFRNRLLNQV